MVSPLVSFLNTEIGNDETLSDNNLIALHTAVKVNAVSGVTLTPEPKAVEKSIALASFLRAFGVPVKTFLILSSMLKS